MYGRTLNSRILRLHGKFVCTIYHEQHSFFRYLFDRGRSVSFHIPNLHIFATEMFKGSKAIATKVFGNNLKEKETNLLNDDYVFCLGEEN